MTAGGGISADQRVEVRRLGMAECGWRGLSDGWALRHLGDVHWQLIAQALGQDRAVFADDAGRPVYAAFCAVSLRVDAPGAVAPGAELTIVSRLRRVSAARLVSVHDMPGVGRAVMISAFVRHGADGTNRGILRAQPRGVLAVPGIAAGEDGGLAASAAVLARGAAEMAETGPAVPLTPCPWSDFNAAGLLYCASFPALADRAAWAAAPDPAPRAVVRREIVFLGNLDPGVALIVAPAGPSRQVMRAEGRVLAVIDTTRA